MDDIPAQEPAQEPEGAARQEAGHDGLARRDFLKAAAILSGSMLLMLSRCRLPTDTVLPPISPNFKRFILTEQSPTVAAEQIVVALGAQCPDLKCSLWWVENQELKFFESVKQIDKLYVQNGRKQFFWLD